MSANDHQIGTASTRPVLQCQPHRVPSNKVARWGILALAAMGLSMGTPAVAKDQWEREVTRDGQTYKVGVRENGDGFIRKGFLKFFETDEIFDAIEIIEAETGCRVTRHLVMGHAQTPHQIRAKLDCSQGEA